MNTPNLAKERSRCVSLFQVTKIAWNTITSRNIKFKYCSSSSQSNEGLILPPNGNLYQQNFKFLGGAGPNFPLILSHQTLETFLNRQSQQPIRRIFKTFITQKGLFLFLIASYIGAPLYKLEYQGIEKKTKPREAQEITKDIDMMKQ